MVFRDPDRTFHSEQVSLAKGRDKIPSSSLYPCFIASRQAYLEESILMFSSAFFFNFSKMDMHSLLFWKIYFYKIESSYQK